MTDPFADKQQFPAATDGALVPEYEEWSVKDRFAIDLPAEDYLARLRVWLPRVLDGQGIWEADTRADRSLPEYLEELGRFTREQRDEARRFWSEDAHVTRSFLNYLNQYVEVLESYGPPATIAEWWREDPHAEVDLPTYARKMQAAKVRMSEMAEQAGSWTQAGRPVSLIEWVKKHAKVTSRTRWF